MGMEWNGVEWIGAERKGKEILINDKRSKSRNKRSITIELV